jgi:succinate dehydrogenase/fumarate reductase flavoprotein subunit
VTPPDRFDVVVVGAGAAGLIAAIEAADAGASVVLLQKNAAVGGVSTWSVGSVVAGGTSLQARRGIDDDRERHRADVFSWATTPETPALTRAKLDLFVNRSPDVVERLLGLGVTFGGPHPEGLHSRYRMHVFSPNSIDVMALLGQRALERGVRIRCDTPATRLLLDGDHVIGVGTASRDVLARGGVVLATGDYSQGRDDHPRPPGSRFSFRTWTTGDGHFLAAAAGANVRNMDEQLRLDLRTVDWPYVKPEQALYDAGAVLLTRSGRRVGKERALDPHAVAEECDEDLFVVFDGRVAAQIATAQDDSVHARDGWQRTGRLFVCTFPGIAYGYVDDLVDVGHAARGDDLAAVARQMGIERLDRGAHGLERPPFVAIGPCRYRSFSSMATVDCDLELRALRSDGSAIPGLYVAGNLSGRASTGGSHGYGLGWAFVSGTVAAAGAAA